MIKVATSGERVKKDPKTIVFKQNCLDYIEK